MGKESTFNFQAIDGTLDISSLNMTSGIMKTSTGNLNSVNQYSTIQDVFQMLYNMGYNDAVTVQPKKKIKIDENGHIKYNN